MKAKHIGTVEVLRPRAYPLDPQARGSHATEALVDPGAFPLYQTGITKFWVMEGRLNVREFTMGDGMFSIQGNDEHLSGLTLRFPSRFYGPDQWNALVEDPIATEDSEEQRLRITEI